MSILDNLLSVSPFGIQKRINDKLDELGINPSSFVKGLFDELQSAPPNNGGGTIPPNFTGGQCNTGYWIYWIIRRKSDGALFPEFLAGGSEVPIQSITPFDDSGSLAYRIVDSQSPNGRVGALGFSSSTEEVASFRVARRDGLPDNCGDPPSIPDPNSPPDLNLYLPVNLPVPIPPNLPIPLPRIPLPPWIPIPLPPTGLPNPNDPTGNDPLTKSDGKKLEEKLDQLNENLDRLAEDIQCIRSKVCATVGRNYYPCGTFTEAGAYIVPMPAFGRLVGVNIWVKERGSVSTKLFAYDKYYKKYWLGFGDFGFVSESNHPEEPTRIVFDAQRIVPFSLEPKGFYFRLELNVFVNVTAIIELVSGDANGGV
jgi:hypothetical protein